MKKEIALIATAAITLATLAVGNTLAFFTDQGKVDNVVTMGNVKITLTEPEFKNTTNGTYSVEFMPGDVITKDPTVTNVGDNDAYVRCKVNIVNGSSDSSGAVLTQAEKDELLKNLNINADAWALSGDGYYYYQKILPKTASGQNTSTQLFNTVTIPLKWGSSDYPVDNLHFQIVICAEAVQADNFKPATDSSGKIVAWNYSNGSPVKMESSAVSASSAGNP